MNALIGSSLLLLVVTASCRTLPLSGTRREVGSSIKEANDYHYLIKMIDERYPGKPFYLMFPHSSEDIVAFEAAIQGNRLSSGSVGGTVMRLTPQKRAELPQDHAWSYYVEPSSASYFKTSIEECDSSMDNIERNLDDWLDADKRVRAGDWCPWSGGRWIVSIVRVDGPTPAIEPPTQTPSNRDPNYPGEPHSATPFYTDILRTTVCGTLFGSDIEDPQLKGEDGLHYHLSATCLEGEGGKCVSRAEMISRMRTAIKYCVEGNRQTAPSGAYDLVPDRITRK